MDCWQDTPEPRGKIIQVAAACLIDADAKVLVQQRPQGKNMAGLWEFPGGKIEMGESPQLALMRELHEELQIETRESCMAPLNFTTHQYTDFYLIMFVFAIRKWQGAIQTPLPIKWCNLQDFQNLPMPDADYPLIAHLRDYIW